MVLFSNPPLRALSNSISIFWNSIHLHKILIIARKNVNWNMIQNQFTVDSSGIWLQIQEMAVGRVALITSLNKIQFSGTNTLETDSNSKNGSRTPAFWILFHKTIIFVEVWRKSTPISKNGCRTYAFWLFFQKKTLFFELWWKLNQNSKQGGRTSAFLKHFTKKSHFVDMWWKSIQNSKHDSITNVFSQLFQKKNHFLSKCYGNRISTHKMIVKRLPFEYFSRKH